jgi:hypothetical protein
MYVAPPRTVATVTTPAGGAMVPEFADLTPAPAPPVPPAPVPRTPRAGAESP